MQLSMLRPIESVEHACVLSVTVANIRTVIFSLNVKLHKYTKYAVEHGTAHT